MYSTFSSWNKGTFLVKQSTNHVNKYLKNSSNFTSSIDYETVIYDNKQNNIKL